MKLRLEIDTRNAAFNKCCKEYDFEGRGSRALCKPVKCPVSLEAQDYLDCLKAHNEKLQQELAKDPYSSISVHLIIIENCLKKGAN